MRAFPLLLALILLAALAAGCSPRTGNDESASRGGNVAISESAQEPAQSPSSTAVDEASSSASEIVHATATGKRYHRAGCRFLAKSDLPLSRKDAEARGLTPCHVCKP